MTTFYTYPDSTPNSWQNTFGDTLNCTHERYEYAPELTELNLFPTSFEELSIGEVYTVGSLTNSTYTRIDLGEGEYADRSFTLSSPAFADVSLTVAEPTDTSIKSAVVSKLEALVPGHRPALTYWEQNPVYSPDHLQVILRSNYRNHWKPIQKAFDFGNKDNTNILVNYSQIYYELTQQQPERPSDLFAIVPSLTNWGNHSPAYVSSIKYGRQLYFMITSADERDEVMPAIEILLKAVDSGLEPTLTSRQVRILKSAEIKAFLIEENKYGVELSLSGDWKKLKALIKDGATFSGEDIGAPISYSLRYLKDNTEVGMVISSSYVIQNCKPKPVDVSPCARDLIAQITGELKLNIGRPDESYSFPPTSMAVTGHVQGGCLLPDADGKSWAYQVDNGTPEGFRLGSRDIVGSAIGLYSEDRSYEEIVTFPIRNIPAYGNHDHPGGSQAQGEIIAVAMEGGAASNAAVYFLRVEGSKVSYIQTLHLGVNFEPNYINTKSARAVGMVQMESGKYLIAVDGDYGVLFYESSSPYLTPHTRWKFRKLSQPACRGFGTEDDQCYDGSSAVNLIRDCSGEIFLVAMNGTRGRGRDHQYFQAFRVDLSRPGAAALEKVTQQISRVGLIAARNESFRWLGSTYVTEGGRVVFMNSKRGDGLLNKVITGYLYFGKPF